MKLSGLHILLTVQCTRECEHCFMWGGPHQRGTLSIEQIKQILDQAKELGVEWIYFEGGEPFIYYDVLVEGVRLAAEMGFSNGIVSNAYWASSVPAAVERLQPFAGCVSDLTVSSDFYHGEDELSDESQNAIVAAKWLKIPTGMISVAKPGEDAAQAHGQIKDQSSVMYRGRAAVRLARKVDQRPWDEFIQCPHEDMREPGRLHLDPFGNLHICQGIVIGNMFDKPLKEICEGYDAETHPVCGPLLEGGPVALISEYHLPHEAAYADACHLCYEARRSLRTRFPEVLGPDQMYGVNHERK